jgi:hypothetical protein
MMQTRERRSLMREETAPSSRPPFGWPELLIVLATALELGVVLLAHHFPYTDPPNHLARYALIARLWFGDPPGYVIMRWVPTSYIAGDIVGALFVHYAGAVATLRLINVATVVLLPLGMYGLLVHSAPAQRGWALIGVLFGFASPFLFGFLNYALGLGLVFCWLALWYPRRESAGWTARALLSAGVIVLFLVHLSAPLIVLVVIWTDWGIAAIGENEILPPRQWRLANPRLPTVLLVTAAVVLVWIGASYSSWNDTGPSGEYVFRTFGNKLLALASPFYSVSLPAAAVMAAGYVASLGVMLYWRRRTLRIDSLAASGVIMFVLYLLFPKAIPGAGAVDIRWLSAGYLLLFCGRRTALEREPRLVLLLPFFVCVVHTLLIGWSARSIDRELDHYEVALSHVPPRTTLLPLADGVKLFGRVPVLRHFVLWHVIDRKGRAPGIFNYRDAHDQDPLNHHLAHFIEPTHLFYADNDWGSAHNMAGLPWPRIDSEYDYIMLTSGNSRLRNYVGSHADEVWHDNEFALYKVRKS